MQTPPIPKNERARLKALDSFSILDTLPETEYDNITKIASEIAQTPIALVSLIDKNRQWFKSHHGLDATETPRDLAFCAHAINTPETMFEIPDARKDERFYDNPLVVESPNVIFYAGMPLVTEGGNALGTLCVIDHQPKMLTSKQKEAIQALAIQVVHLLELRKAKLDLETAQRHLQDQVSNLEEFANITALDVKSPLGNIVMISDVISNDYTGQVPQEVLDLTHDIKVSASHTRAYIDALSRYTKVYELLKAGEEECKLQNLAEAVWKSVAHHETASLECEHCDQSMTVNTKALRIVLAELFVNAIRFTTASTCTVKLTLTVTEDSYTIAVSDNGPGFAGKDITEACKLFSKFVYEDKFSVPCTGIGLATVNKIITGLGGQLTMKQNASGEGSSVEFTLPA